MAGVKPDLMIKDSNFKNHRILFEPEEVCSSVLLYDTAYDSWNGAHLYVFTNGQYNKTRTARYRDSSLPSQQYYYSLNTPGAFWETLDESEYLSKYSIYDKLQPQKIDGPLCLSRSLETNPYSFVTTEGSYPEEISWGLDGLINGGEAGQVLTADFAEWDSCYPPGGGHLSLLRRIDSNNVGGGCQRQHHT